MPKSSAALTAKASSHVSLAEFSSRKKGSKTKKVAAISGIEKVAALGVVIDALAALRDSLLQSLHGDFAEVFSNEVREYGCEPDKTFVATEGRSKMSITLKMRSSTSPLKPDEVETLNKGGVAPTTKKGGLEINKEYKDDQSVLAALNKLIAKLPRDSGIPADFVSRASDKLSVPWEDVWSEILMMDDLQKMLPLLTIATTFSTSGAEIEGEDGFAHALAIVEAIMKPAPEPAKKAAPKRVRAAA